MKNSARNLFLFFALFFALEVFSQNTDTNLFLAQKLISAYPDFLDRYENGFIVWKDGTKMLFDDGKPKSFEELLNSPDLQDMFAFGYPQGDTFTAPGYNQDPGRIRYEPFFKKMYGATKQEVLKNLDTVIWLPSSLHKKILITRINGISEKLQAISDELDTIPGLRKYVEQLGGTFNWRYISGTHRLSAHSFGIAIDINVKYSNYWRWEPQKAKVYKNRIPLRLVKIFEKHGFIWGGKWYHFDTMHFEYRPELLK